MADGINGGTSEMGTAGGLTHAGDERVRVPVPVGSTQTSERRDESYPAAVRHCVGQGHKISDAAIGEQICRPRQGRSRGQDVPFKGVGWRPVDDPCQGHRDSCIAGGKVIDRSHH